MSEPRAWVVIDDARDPEEVPAFLVGEDVIRWPGVGMPEKPPGKPAEYFTPEDLYYRHPIIEGEVYMFVHSKRDPNGIPERIRAEILRRAGKQ